MIRRWPIATAAVILLLQMHAVFAAPSSPAANAALSYASALASGDYAKAYGLLASESQRYFASLDNFRSVWTADRFSGTRAEVLKASPAHGGALVMVREKIAFFNHGTQRMAQGTITTPYTVIRERGAYRVVDGGHPYRSIVPSGIVAGDSGGVRVIVRELAFYPRRIEVTLTFENDSNGFVTFLPYGRTLLRDGTARYHPLATRDWLLTDRQLFLGLRLAADARYTGQINFAVTSRAGDGAHAFALVVAPALPAGADRPEEFRLPPIIVPS
ncbi:MAG: hypothetical protein ACRENA_17010 [Vulcanimicrobiaceae bacterium]